MCGVSLDAGRLHTITGKLGAVTLTSYTYTYSGADTALRRSVTDHDAATTTYGYDPAERLTSAVTKDVLGATTAATPTPTTPRRTGPAKRSTAPPRRSRTTRRTR